MGQVRNVRGHGPPPDAAIQDVEDGVDDLSSGHFCGSASRLGSGDEGLEARGRWGKTYV